MSANPLPIADPRDATPFEPPSPPAARATNDDDDGDSAWLWPRFCEIVWDTLAKGAANDIVSFRSLCERLWRPFVAPVVDGTCGARNLSRLLVLKRDIFKDESVLSEGVVPETTTSTDLEKASKGNVVQSTGARWIRTLKSALPRALKDDGIRKLGGS